MFHLLLTTHTDTDSSYTRCKSMDPDCWTEYISNIHHMFPKQSDSSYTRCGPSQRIGARSRPKRTATEKRTGERRNDKRRGRPGSRERGMLLNLEGQTQRPLWRGEYRKLSVIFKNRYIRKFLRSLLSFYNPFSNTCK